MFMSPEIKKLKPTKENDEPKDFIDPWQADMYSLGISFLNMIYPEVKNQKKLLKKYR